MTLSLLRLSDIVRVCENEPSFERDTEYNATFTEFSHKFLLLSLEFICAVASIERILFHSFSFSACTVQTHIHTGTHTACYSRLIRIVEWRLSFVILQFNIQRSVKQPSDEWRNKTKQRKPETKKRNRTNCDEIRIETKNQRTKTIDMSTHFKCYRILTGSFRISLSNRIKIKLNF